jgi:hypothetical protein
MKKVGIGMLLLLILTGITVWVTQQDRSSTMRKELTDFAIADTAAIDEIILKDEQGKRILLKRVDNGWTVNDLYAARPDAVDILLRTMNKLSIKAPISETMKNTVLKNIIAKHTLVEAYQGGELIKTYFVGGPDREHTGTFMMMKGSSRPYLMHIEGFHGFLTPRFFTNENEWRERVVFEHAKEDIQRLEVQYMENPEQNFLIERTAQGGFGVYSGEENEAVNTLDTFMLNAYLARYDMVHFEGFEETKTEAFIDSVMQSEPMFTITLTDRNDVVTTATGFRKPLSDGYDYEGNPIDYDQDRLYLKINDDKVVVAQYAIFDPLTRGIGFLRNR